MQNHKSSRRDFLLLSAGTALSIAALAHADDKPSKDATASTAPKGKGLRILILGGTAFLGPALIEAAKARGHSITTFNRGKTEKRIGSIDGIEKLFGNRDPNLRSDDADPASPQGLSQIEEAIKAGTTWDAVIDTSGYVPRVVTASAELLSKACKHYIFISTISVYASNDQPNADETAPTAELEDSRNENFQEPQLYGPLKAACERAAEEAMPGKVTNIRPGFIVGPGDPTDRFTYWPVRAAKGGEMLWPGEGTEPVQFVDVRDLAAFAIHCVERGHMGVFNVTGPSMQSDKSLTVKEFAEACAALAPADNPLKPVWVPWSFLEGQQGVNTTILIPPEGEVKAFHLRSYAKALKAGLTLRPVAQTVADTNTWWPKEVARRERVGKGLIEDGLKSGKPVRQTLEQLMAMRQGMSADVENAVLKAFAESKK
jgi:2'-hydroxyisoflavone reductase